MQLSLESHSGYNQIHAYTDKQVVVRSGHQAGLIILEASFILTADSLIDNWVVDSIDHITQSHCAQLQDLRPDVVLFASASGRINPEPVASLLQAGIGVEFMTIGAACRTFNLLIAEHRPVVLAVIRP